MRGAKPVRLCGKRLLQKERKNERKCHNQARTRPGASQKAVVLTWVRKHGNILGKKGKKRGDVGNNQALRAACRILITGSRSLEGEASVTGGVTEQDGKLVPSCELPGCPSLRLSASALNTESSGGTFSSVFPQPWEWHSSENEGCRFSLAGESARGRSPRCHAAATAVRRRASLKRQLRFTRWLCWEVWRGGAWLSLARLLHGQVKQNRRFKSFY